MKILKTISCDRNSKWDWSYSENCIGRW